jgi:hemolysin-activating ACP:hemolysin acyltransferase
LRVLSSDAGYQHLPLSEVRWLVAPAMVTGQFRAAESRYGKDKEDTGFGPVAVVSWALLSTELDNQLRQRPDAPLRLTPAQWKSGDIPWIMLAAGRKSSRDRIIQQLLEKEFKGRDVIVRVMDDAGKISLAAYNQSSGIATKGS